MRRLFLPVVALAVMIAASLLATAADDAADPDTSDSDAGASLVTPLLSVRRAPEWLRQPATELNLASAVREVVGGLGEADLSCVSIHRDGVPIAEVEPAASLIPGHLQRLATLTAFDNLGSAGFITNVVRDSADVITDGALDGDLWLVGGADPVLGTEDFIQRFGDDRAHTSLEELANTVVEALRQAEVTTIRGSVIGDESKYADAEREYREPFWTPADVASNIAGPISALLVNDGFDEFPAEVDPPSYSRAENPAIHAASKLTELIEAAGIVVDGAPGTGSQPDATRRTPVASIESPPIAEIAQRALVDATTAEMLFREIAVRSGRDATGLSAAFAVSEALVDSGVVLEEDAGFTSSFDGSGVSNSNRLTCDVLVNILDAPQNALANSALASVEQTPLAICAPTGLDSLHALATARDTVSGVAGQVEAANGDLLTFAMIVNWAPDPITGAREPRGECDDVIPALLGAIGEYPVGPDVDDLAPLNAVVDG